MVLMLSELYPSLSIRDIHAVVYHVISVHNYPPSSWRVNSLDDILLICGGKGKRILGWTRVGTKTMVWQTRHHLFGTHTIHHTLAYFATVVITIHFYYSIVLLRNLFIISWLPGCDAFIHNWCHDAQTILCNDLLISPELRIVCKYHHLFSRADNKCDKC